MDAPQDNQQQDNQPPKEQKPTVTEHLNLKVVSQDGESLCIAGSRIAWFCNECDNARAGCRSENDLGVVSLFAVADALLF